MPLIAIFFDVGNTLLFASPERTLAPLAARGITVTQDQLHAAERAAKHFLDEARARHESVDAKYWDIYYSDLLQQLGREDAALKDELVAATRTSGNWRRLQPHTRAVLLRLKRDFRLGVISNSDGRVRHLLESVGLGDCFDSFTDSALVGYEKPDLRIFRVALESLRAEAAQSLYVGDIYSVDYLGARAAGMHAVLMDAAGTYRDMGLERIATLAELEPMLSSICP